MKPNLLSHIEEFAARHEMSLSTFGSLALNDCKFVAQLKGGRRLWPETEKKVRVSCAVSRAAATIQESLS